MPTTGRTSKGQTAGKSSKTFGGKVPSVDIAFTTYTEQPLRQIDEEEVHGALHALVTGQPLDDVPTDLVVTNGQSRLMLVINAGSALSGSITVTGTSVDRNSGVETPADTETLTVTGLSTDTSAPDVRGNNVKGMTDCPITTKWWLGSVTFSTTDLTLTDVDVYQVAYEQVKDQPGLTLTTFDCDVTTSHANAWMYLYLYTVVVANGLATVVNVASHIVDADAVADKHYRPRKGNLGIALDGTTDGFFYDAFFGPTAQTYINDLTVKVWVNVAQSSGPGTAGPYLLRSQGDFATFAAKGTPVDADILLIEDSAASGAKKKIALTNLLNLVADLTPQLGGDLDLNGKAIVVDAAGAAQIVDENGDEMLVFRRNGATAVDYFKLYNADAAGDPEIECAGASGDIHFIATPKGDGTFIINSTSALQVPSGTTGERPGGVNRMIRYNTTEAEFEGYADGAWGAIGGGGGAGDVVGPAGATDNALSRFDTATGKLLQDSKLLGADVGVGGSNVDFLTIVNDVSGIADTESSILFQQDDSGSTLRDLARITAGVEEAWTATATTRKGFLAFHTSFDGTVSEAMRVHSGVDSAGTNLGSILGVNTGDDLGGLVNAPGLDVRSHGTSANVLVFAARDTNTGVASLTLARARGTSAISGDLGAGDALENLDNIARFFARGWTGANWRAAARMDWLVDGPVTDTLLPTEYTISTGSSGAGTVRLRIRAAGGIEISGGQILSFTAAANTIQAPTAVAMNIGSPTLTMESSFSLFLKTGGNTMFQSTDIALGFFGSAATQPNYTVTNPSTLRSIDVVGISDADLREVVGTIISDMIANGLFG